MKILITGGAGFIGSHLSEKHLQENDQVFVIDNLLTGSLKNIQPLTKDKNFKFYQADVLSFDFAFLPKMDVVYHLASPASPVWYRRYPLKTLMVNSFGTKRVLDFVKGRGAKTNFVLASTSEIYGDPLEHPQKETYWGNVNTLGERACYDEGKRFAETLTINYFKKFSLSLRIARIFNTYGPKMQKNDGRVISNFIDQALNNRPITIYGDGQQTRSFSYVSDLVNGLLKMGVEKNIDGQAINLGNPEEITILKTAKKIIEMTKSKSQIIFEKLPEDDPKRRKPDVSKAKKMIKWKIETNFEKGLEKTIEYFKKLL